MPYSSVGGFPPLPTQTARGSVYEPKQTISYITSQHPPRRAVKDAPPRDKDNVQFHNDVPHPGGPATQTDALPSIVAALPSPSATGGSSDRVAGRNSSSQRQGDYSVSCEFSGREGNPWSGRTTIAELEDRRLHNSDGVAAFRPIRYITLAAAEVQSTSTAAMSAFLPISVEVSSSTAVKPLLEPFVDAQELARQASEETWHTRRLRYLQWLRKGALTAKKKEEEKEGRERSVSPALGDVSLHVSCRSMSMGADSVFSGPPRSAAPLSPLERGSTWRGDASDRLHDPESTCTFGKSDLNFLQGGRLEENALTRFLPITYAANPNEVAVRQMFRMVRGPTLTPISTPTAACKEAVAVNGDEEEHTTTAAVSPVTSGHKIDVPLIDDAHSFVDEDGFSFSPTQRNESESNEESDSTSTAPKLTAEPPPEYAVAGLLRQRMHNTVAVFTASSTHTLDTPPRKTTRAIFGQARLRSDVNSEGNAEAERWKISAAAPASATSSVMPDRLDDGETPESCPLIVLSQQPRTLAPHVARRIVYEETYERGLLTQLAFQSSPTRWYSTDLPSGGDGIAFRGVYAPTMLPDEALEMRLNNATSRIMQSIAQPRYEAVQAIAAREKQWTDSLAALHAAPRQGGPSSSSERAAVTPNTNNTIDAAPVTVEEAARQKELLFRQWTRLHRNLSAQWQLLHEERAERLCLLGRFVSCAYPEPCICLECDQEVLNMSAIPLEPAVQPLCWFTSVVLSEHHDVLQKEMLRQHEEGLAAMYEEFRLLFITTYTREKLLEEEARRFQTMMRYHAFCLRVAAQNASADETGSLHGATPAPNLVTEAAFSGTVELPTGADPRMWRLRQRRLQAFKAFDSPFFSYLVYTEMSTISSAEEQVRQMLIGEEATARKELATVMRMDERFSCLLALERLDRSWISAEMVESHSAMMSGPLVQLHAAHLAELREKEAAAYAKKCAEERQAFEDAAVEATHAMAEAEYATYKILVRETRQRFLTLLVADRAPADSVEVSRKWLHEQRQSVLLRAEQRLRDQLVLDEEPSAFQQLLDSAVDSFRQVKEREAQRQVDEQAEAEAAEAEAARATAQARARATAEELAQLQWENMLMDPKLLSGAKPPASDANDFTPLTMSLKKDFAFFLSALD
ncbi:hypothetical protein ABB37_01692 [Leptomonas pyrrhocoris]|uniref:Uncharacterized protein n=1 Tax=Leptomonas pyrrhocoris TaxID=157538 RepID=A0A0M9G9G6_LEPPY|nr:hypothetical protein ABB37_01692 [Leptomonas pyrrhocoris]KPA85376.1 hypothetical protein ABB37_01692 [Leptomonas pyrrhocoris]|eukprot:XP_015663815.1 hypothetical protein ABB37_01692 [Leptomonas pyrrhocoris]